MRTLEEVREKFAEKQEAFMSWWPEILGSFLPVEDIKPLMKDDYLEKIESGEKVWEQLPLKREVVIVQMRQYMDFAWEKALDERGISASRSIDKMQAWIWLLCDQDEIDWEDYADYGKPILQQICEKYDFPIVEADYCY